MATITVARDAAHALTLANDSEFGLSATVFTASVDEAGRFLASWSAVASLSTVTAPAMRAWRLAG